MIEPDEAGDKIAGERIRPEWLRLPKKGRCPYSGLSRSALNELILGSEQNGGRPAVKSVSLRKRGQLRGTRLINYDSLMDYIASQADVDGGNREEVRE
jgi:hypothetical protein